MKGLPMFFNLEGKKVLIIGGGRSATIKIKTFLDFGADIQVIGEKICSEVWNIFLEQKEKVHEKVFQEDDLQGVSMVFAAADRETNQKVYVLAKDRKILCGTSNGDGDFILPAYRKKGNLTVAVSTNGKYPLLGMEICEKVDLSDADRLDQLEKKRQWVISNIQDQEEKRRILRELLIENKEFENIE